MFSEIIICKIFKYIEKCNKKRRVIEIDKIMLKIRFAIKKSNMQK